MAEQTESLGTLLRALRQAAGLTLREVQGKCALNARCGVSNGYLNLLEHDRVKAPNPNVLFTLAECYGADYAELLRRAGYPVPAPAGAGRPAIVFAGAEQLTPEDREEIQAIIALKLRRRRAAGRSRPT